MSTNRHLHRTAIFATASLVFAVSATGTAFAWVRSDSVSERSATTLSAPAAQSPAAAAAAAVFNGASLVVPTASASPAKAAEATIPPKVETKAVASKTPAPSKPAATKAAHAKALATTSTKTEPTKASAITIDHYVNKPGSQSSIDKCNLVLWTQSPLWLAGHNWCGYQWMAFVPTGTTVTVTHGLAAGTYIVTDHLRLTRQSGELPTLNADLVLQTCVGDGTGLTLLKRI